MTLYPNLSDEVPIPPAGRMNSQRNETDESDDVTIGKLANSLLGKDENISASNTSWFGGSHFRSLKCSDFY